MTINCDIIAPFRARESQSSSCWLANLPASRNRQPDELDLLIYRCNSSPAAIAHPHRALRLCKCVCNRNVITFACQRVRHSERNHKRVENICANLDFVICVIATHFSINSQPFATAFGAMNYTCDSV